MEEEYEEQAQTLARWRHQVDLARALIHSGHRNEALAILADLKTDLYLSQILGLPKN